MQELEELKQNLEKLEALISRLNFISKEMSQTIGVKNVKHDDKHSTDYDSSNTN